MKNPYCDNDKCIDSKSEVRVLPLNRGINSGNIILWHACYEYEMKYRKERAIETKCPENWDIPEWSSLRIYQQYRQE